MKALIKLCLIVAGAFCAYSAYWVALILFSFQTLTIDNQTDRQIEVQIYDLSWIVDSRSTEVVRFQSNKGDAHFTILEAATQEEIGGAGYLTVSMPDCHRITISGPTQIGYDTDYSSFCHILTW